jgi:ABC-2 type transport system ATP-binding protein
VVWLLSHAGVPFAEVAAHRASLEQAYLDLTAGQEQYTAQPAGASPAHTVRAGHTPDPDDRTPAPGATR